MSQTGLPEFSSHEGASRRAGALLPFVLFVALLYALGVNPFWRFQRDSALYMGLARSLAETGTYSFNGQEHILVWPGFPGMLSVVYRAFGESFLAMNVLVSIFAVGAIGMACLLYRRLPLSRRQALACMLLLAFSRTLYYYSTHVMSEVPFLFFVVLGLYCGTRMLQTTRGASWWWCLGASAAACTATFMRPLGPALVIALVLALWSQPGRWRSLPARVGKAALVVAPLAAAGALWLRRCSLVESRGAFTYYEAFVGRYGPWRSALSAVGRVPSLLDALPDALTGLDLGLPVGALLALAMVVGLVRALRDGERLLCAYGAVYLAAICLGAPGRRYLLPALPALCYWLVVGVGVIGAWVTGREAAARRRAVLVGQALLLLVLAANGARAGKLVWEARRPDFYAVIGGGRLVPYFDAAHWFERHATGQTVVLAYEHRFLHYFSRVRSVRLSRNVAGGNEGRLVELMRQAAVTHVLHEPDKDRAGPLLARLAAARPGALTNVRQFGHLELLRVDADKLGEGEP